MEKSGRLSSSEWLYNEGYKMMARLKLREQGFDEATNIKASFIKKFWLSNSVKILGKRNDTIKDATKIAQNILIFLNNCYSFVFLHSL